MNGKDISSADELTGLPTLSAFSQALQAGAAKARETDEALSLALVDIDFFKRLNDTHGREAGDLVLQALAKHLSASAAGGSVFRYAADEFAVILPGVAKEQAFLAMEQARAGFDKEHVFTKTHVRTGSAQSLDINQEQLRVGATISGGIASYGDDGETWVEIVRKAEDALHRAKVGDRNRIRLAREEKMVTKTSHFTQGQLKRLSQLSKCEGVTDAVLLREALDDLLRKRDV